MVLLLRRCIITPRSYMLSRFTRADREEIVFDSLDSSEALVIDACCIWPLMAMAQWFYFREDASPELVHAFSSHLCQQRGTLA
mmetsp:Transcript_161983/g.519347  ORF Transcript_161983/g.519347 Transcript_161983/m.519347 type:complete len:83 (-) Transcript_161983:483-731(-)